MLASTASKKEAGVSIHSKFETQFANDVIKVMLLVFRLNAQLPGNKMHSLGDSNKTVIVLNFHRSLFFAA